MHEPRLLRLYMFSDGMRICACHILLRFQIWMNNANLLFQMRDAAWRVSMSHHVMVIRRNQVFSLHACVWVRIPINKLNSTPHSFLILVLAISACAVTALAVYRLIELQRTASITTQMEKHEAQTGEQHAGDDKLELDQYALRVNLTHYCLSSSQMAQLGRLPDLKVLDLSRAKLPPEGIAALKGKALEELSLQGTHLTNAGAVLPSMNHLARLDLSETPIGDETVAALRHAPALKWLDLHDTGITDNALSSLAQMPVLECTAVSGEKITDEGLRKLTSAPRLLRIRLINAQITAGAVSTLVRACPTLRYVVFQHCPKIGPAEIEELSHRFPECRIRNQ